MEFLVAIAISLDFGYESKKVRTISLRKDTLNIIKYIYRSKQNFLVETQPIRAL